MGGGRARSVKLHWAGSVLTLFSFPAMIPLSPQHPPHPAPHPPPPAALAWSACWDQSGVLYVLLFILFCKCLPTFPSVFNVPLPSACSCRATRRKSLCDPPAAANSFARCVRVSLGKRLLLARVRQLGGWLPGRGNGTGGKFAERWGSSGCFQVQMKERLEGPGSTWVRLMLSPWWTIRESQRVSWDPRVPLRGPRWLVFRGSVALTRRPPPFPAALLQRKVLCVLSAHSPVSRPSLVPRPVSDSALSLVSQQLHTSLPGG